jgi:glutathione S-transferase
VESVVIAKYLIQTYDKDHKFRGSGGKNDWIREEELCHLAAASIGPIIVFETVMTMAARLTPFFVRPLVSLVHKQIATQWCYPDLDLMFTYLDGKLEGQDYFMGPEPALPDFIISHVAHTTVDGGMINIKKYPRVEKWHLRCQERPAWKRSLEKGGGYDMAFHDPV